jgi:hypothetical protein
MINAVQVIIKRAYIVFITLIMIGLLLSLFDTRYIVETIQWIILLPILSYAIYRAVRYIFHGN